MRPSRGLLTVRPVATEEVVNGIVLLDETRQRWTGQQCEVVAVGYPEWCEAWPDCERENRFHIGLMSALGGAFPQEPQMHKHDIKKGDWLLVRPRCFVATDIEGIWVCKQSDVLAKLVLERGTR